LKIAILKVMKALKL